MATSNDHPGLLFVQAAGYTVGRPDGRPLWIVVHDMEATEHSARAENTAAYFANPGDGRRVSAHYCVDDNSVVQCVDLDDSAWTVGNRPGNNRGINWELSGFASQTRAQWLDTFGRAMFAQMADIVRADAARFGIPLQRRTVAELKAFVPGVTSHNDLRLAFGGTTHTDPGAAFPWDEFMAALTTEGTDNMLCQFGDADGVAGKVGALQATLARLGYLNIATDIDGNYGNKTRDALKAALATVGWIVDGTKYWAGEWAALQEVVARKWAAGTPGPAGPQGPPGPKGDPGEPGESGTAIGQSFTVTVTA